MEFGYISNKWLKLEYTITPNTDKRMGGLLIEKERGEYRKTGKIGNVKGVSPQMGTMISMLEDLKDHVEEYS
jgi:hypothetical protein